jgi:hypothetical protein
VLLDSYGRLTRIGDANRVKYWLETGGSMPAEKASPRKVTTKHRVSGTLAPSSAKSAPQAKPKTAT